MEINCIYCDTVVSERAIFCKSCSKQVKCKSCKEILEADANACVICGEELIKKNEEGRMNTIEFSEGKAGRAFKATFTDTVGNNISDTFSLFLANKIGFKSAKSNILSTDDEQLETDVQEENTVAVLLENNDENTLFKKIFKVDGDKASLVEPRLKATSKMDYGKRLICLYLYFKKLNGFEKLPRIEVTQILKQASVEDGNLRKWIVNESTLIRQSNEELELLLPGSEFAKQVLAEINDSNILEKWKLGTKAKSTKKHPTKIEPSEEK